MVQIIRAPERKPSFGELVGANLGAGLGKGAQLGMEQILNEDLEKKKFARQLELEDVRHEKSMELQGLKNSIAQQKQQQQKQQDKELEDVNYEKVKNAFGNDFANVWKAAPTGGRTELLKYALDSVARGENIQDLLANVKQNQPNEFQESKKPSENLFEGEAIPQIKNGKIPKDFKWPDYSKRPLGYTPKDWVKQKADWRKENAPVFQENKTKLKSNINDELAIKKLKKLNKSKKLPEDLERFLINPSTGELYGLAQISGAASPETQEWLKETARFQNRAKDAFGSRVTNFDLVSYMKQFPTLMNTPEGRERILQMMDINNQLDQSYEKALNQIYMKYGLNGVPQEKAEELAQSMISDETERLNNEYVGLDEKNKLSENEQNETGTIIKVQGPDGKVYEMDSSYLDQLPEGYKIL